MTTVYDRIQAMTKDELQNFILSVYNIGQVHQRCDKNIQSFFESFLDKHESFIDAFFESYRQLEAVWVRTVAFHDGAVSYLERSFISTEDAIKYLTEYMPDIIRINDTTYTTQYCVYQLCDFRGGEHQ